MARILLLDRDQRVYDVWTRIFKKQDYEVETVAIDSPDLDYETCITANRFRPHVAVVDPRLWPNDPEDTTLGFTLIGKYLQSAQCIIFSTDIHLLLSSEIIRKYNIVDWVDKARDPRSDLLEKVKRSARANCAIEGELSITWPTGWDSTQIVDTFTNNTNTNAPLNLLDDVVYQLFHQYKHVELDWMGQSLADTSETPRKHSVVIKAIPDNHRMLFVKIAPSTQIQAEKKNYNRFIESDLNRIFHPVFVADQVFWDLGGILLSSIDTGSTSEQIPLATIKTFSDHFEAEGDPARILEPLQFFFKQYWEHYTTSEVCNASLMEMYGCTLKRDLEARFRDRFQLNEATQSIAGITTTLLFDGVPDALPHPAHWVINNREKSLFKDARKAIIHGDLHGDNLFVGGQWTWVIDFERTGWGHILCDFAELELDILTRLVCWPSNDLSQMYAFARALVNPNDTQPPNDPVFQKAWAVIMGLRSMAQELVTFSTDEYLWGVLLMGLYIASVNIVSPQQKVRTWLLCAVICAHLNENDDLDC